LKQALVSNWGARIASYVCFLLIWQGRYRFDEADVRAVELAPIIADADAVVHLAAMTDAAGSFGRAAEME
jgi:nucleoside-diphosphate-sugar epimerase